MSWVRAAAWTRMAWTLGFLALASHVLPACGGSPAAPGSPVRGVVTGLAGTGLVLQSSVGDEVAVDADGPFSFPTAAAAGSTVTVRVASNPVSPWQDCTVSGSPAVAHAAVEVRVACSTRTFTVGGTASGLAGAGLVLGARFDGGDPVDLDVGGDGPFAFPGARASGTRYAVSVRAQPPGRFCSVTGGMGTVADVDVAGISVVCAANAYRVTGVVRGLEGTGLVLRNGGQDDLPLAPGATGFAFSTPVASGATFDVTVAAQPSRPSQTCAVEGGSGSVGVADVDGVTVTCTANRYRVGGTVLGLQGSGLVLALAGRPPLEVPAGAGTFAFDVPLPSGAPYEVTVAAQPTAPTQSCVVGAGTGLVGGADVTSVVVNCSTDRFLVGGSVLGLTGSGLTLAMRGAGSVDVPAGATAFTFGAPVASGSTYEVTVAAPPSRPSQACVVLEGTGTVAASNVTAIRVVCSTNRYALRGTVSGLSGQGLVLASPGLAPRTVEAGATGFVFVDPIESGQAYAVTVAAQPSAPSETCIVDAGSGVVGDRDVEEPRVSCTVNRYALRGTVSGLAGSGLVLASTGLPDLAVPAGASAFSFPDPVPSGGRYAVTVATQPAGPSQTCAVAGSTGTVGGTDAVVNVTCTTDRFALGGTVTGLVGSGLVLATAGIPSLDVPSGASRFTFGTRLVSGTAYAVAVATQPSAPSQTCAVGSGAGTVVSGDVTGVTVGCATNRYRIRGTVLGLSGTGLVLRDNGGDDLPVQSDGSFAFPTAIASGASYAVTVATQPTGPGQTCTVTAGTGTVGAGDVTGVEVRCDTNRYRIRPTVSGLSGDGLVLRNDGGDDLAVAANGTVTFATMLEQGAAYDVTVAVQPTWPWQTCAVGGGTGTVGSADVTGVTVRCTTDTHRVGGTVSGLTGSGLVLQNSGADALTIDGNGAFTFPTRVASGSGYAVTVRTHPGNPSQVCFVAGGSGTVEGVDVGGVAVQCGDPPTVTVSPAQVDLGGGGTAQLHAAVTNLPSGAVTWSLQEGLRAGAVDASGFYTAPAGGGTFHVVATSAVDPAWSGTATITVTGNAPAAMPVVSRGVPAFASSGTASRANDADYGTEWTASGTSWLAYDLAGAGALGTALVAWYNNDTYGYDLSYGGSADGIPSSYAIELHADTGSNSPPSSGWVTAVTVSGNTRSNRLHTVNLAGMRWIRLSATPASGTLKLNLDVHDAFGGFTDVWAFVGDSNTALYMTHAPLVGQNLAQRVQGAGLANFPAYLNCGVPGLFAGGGQGLGLVQQVLEDYPQVRYVVVTLGGNDSANGLPDDWSFYDSYRAMVDAILAAGRIPVVPRTVIWHGQPTAYRAISDPSPYSLDNQLARLITDYAGQVLVGPDLWSVFDAAPRNGAGQPLDGNGHPLIEADLVHAANPYGMTLARDLWADAIISTAY